MHRASELRCRSFLQRGRRGGGGRRVAGEATQVHAGTRAGSVCQTAGKPGEEGGRVAGFGGLEVMGGRGRRVLLCCLACGAVLFSLSQTEFGSTHSFSLL